MACFSYFLLSIGGSSIDQWTDPRIAGARNYTGSKWRPAILGSMDSSRSISRSSNTSLVGSVGRRADLHRVWTRGRSTLPWNKRCSDEQAQRIFLPSDSVVSVIPSSPDKSTSLPARSWCYFDFSLPRPGLFHTTVHTTGDRVQSIQYARLAGCRSLKRVLLVEVRYDTAFLQPSANSFA